MLYARNNIIYYNFNFLIYLINNMYLSENADWKAELRLIRINPWKSDEILNLMYTRGYLDKRLETYKPNIKDK